MALADELHKLDELRQRGALTDDEYAKAKARLLDGSAPQPGAPPVQTAPLFGGAPGQPVDFEHQTRQWATLLHLSLLAGAVIPYGGLIVPLAIWLVKKNELPGIDAHGKIVVNWMISFVIYSIVCIPLCFVVIGFVLLFALWVMHIVFPIIGAVKANDGVLWKYPLSIQFLS
jgi:uncharacterized Tic20 family protein